MKPQEKAFQELQWRLNLWNQLPWYRQSGIYPLRQAQRHAVDQSWRWDPGSRAARWGSSCRRSRRWILEGTGMETDSSGRSLQEKRGQSGDHNWLKPCCFVVLTSTENLSGTLKSRQIFYDSENVLNPKHPINNKDALVAIYSKTLQRIVNMKEVCSALKDTFRKYIVLWL